MRAPYINIYAGMPVTPQMQASRVAGEGWGGKWGRDRVEDQWADDREHDGLNDTRVITLGVPLGTPYSASSTTRVSVSVYDSI